MKLLPLFFIVFLLLPFTASAKIIGNFSTDGAVLKTVTLDQSRVKENITSVNETKNILPEKKKSKSDDTTEYLGKQLGKGFLTGIADQVFQLGGVTNETEEVKDKYGYAVGSVFKIATYKNDPYESQTVQEMRKRTSLIGLFIFIIFVFLGASRVNLSCGGMNFFDRIEYTITKTVSSISEYKDTLIIALAAIIGVHYIFKFLILFNQAITNVTMYSILESIPLNADNFVMYLAMAVCYGLESIFFGMRILLQDLIAGSDVLIGALFAFSLTRQFAFETVKYFGRITLMQFIIVLLTSFGISIIQELPWLQRLGYLCLIIILIFISGGIMFGFSKLFTSAKTIYRSSRY
jgi:hypothetical protein